MSDTMNENDEILKKIGTGSMGHGGQVTLAN